MLLGCKLENVLSVGIPEKLQELSSQIKAFPEFMQEFFSLPAMEGHTLLMEKSPPEVLGLYQQFMKAFGHRGFREVSPSISSHPALTPGSVVRV